MLINIYGCQQPRAEANLLLKPAQHQEWKTFGDKDIVQLEKKLLGKEESVVNEE